MSMLHRLRRRRGSKMKRQERKWSWGELISTVRLFVLVLMEWWAQLNRDIEVSVLHCA